MLNTQSSGLSAVEAKSQAQWIAFAPFVFQASVALRDLGILQTIADAGRPGIDLPSVAQATGLSEYAISVLVDFASSFGMLCESEGRWRLDKVGWFFLNDEMTRVNTDFSNDVCYGGLAHLQTALREGKPSGLRELGEWDTIYQGLSQLSEAPRRSWFAFDHFYSDRLFHEVLPMVFRRPVRRLMDVGGNTGKWALACLEYNASVQLSIVDLPCQLDVARENIQVAGFLDRVELMPADLLEQHSSLPGGHDVIWMSQFLDCFDEQQIASILRRAAAAMEPETELMIVELFWDRQRFPAATFSLLATSLYFTCLANGNSRMYHSERFLALLEQAGLVVVELVDHIGVGHSLLRCRRADAV